VSYRLIILPQAKADVQRNAEWWARHHSSEQAAIWLDTVQSQLESIAISPASHSLSVENSEFPYEIRDKLLGLGSRPSYRAVFTIKDDTVYVLTVRRAAQNVLRPGDVEAPPTT
jgi:hypothetical protein